MLNYNDALIEIIKDGDEVPSRAGPVLRLSHQFLTFDLRDGFPLLTGRKAFYKGMLAELECFVKGFTNIDEYTSRGCNFWTANLEDWNNKRGTPGNKNLGHIYPYQLRHFNGVDQLRTVINTAKADPTSRRLLVSYWNPADLDKGCLPPCHYSWQLSIVNGYLDLMFTMRSCDMALGFPTDLGHYAGLNHLIANELGLRPRFVSASIADAHIYKQNLDGVKEYLTRQQHPLPQIELNAPAGMPVEQFDASKVVFINYQHESAIDMGGMAP
jgi:thymidylate synthase